MPIERVGTGSAWEARNGYSRAVRAGDWVLLTGTAAFAPDGSVVSPGEAGAQTERCYAIIAGALAQLGLGLEHVVRSRIFLTDMSQADAVGRVHKQLLGANKPCLTLVGCPALVHPDLVVEIECEAWAGE